MNKLIKIVGSFFLLMVLTGVFNSCTDLEEELYSSITKEEVFADPDNLVPIYVGNYASLYRMFGHKYAVGFDCGTDLLCVPQRGGDWLDGGEWHRYHRLTHETDENFINQMWALVYQAISGVNISLDLLNNLSDVDVSAATAELRALRAFYHWKLLDIYGNIIIADSLTEVAKGNSSSQEAYDFVESELLSVLPDLTKEKGVSTFGRVNYYVAYMVLSKLYLNAEVYTGTPQWQKANDAIDSVLSGNYGLANNVADCFGADISNVSEVIWAVPFDEVRSPELEIHLFTLHYVLNEKFGITQGPWNGLIAQESLYNLLAEDENDTRIGGLLYGPQYREDGTQFRDESAELFPAIPFDPDKQPLNLTPAINMLEPNCLRQAGARIQKYPFIEGTGRYMNNDHPIFRSADAMLMKAEVLTWINGNDNADALNILNQVRARSGAAPLTNINADILLDERARELFVEGFRRSDLIRFEVRTGTPYYTGTRWEKPEVSDAHVMLWPIPQQQIDANPKLIQNPGY